MNPRYVAFAKRWVQVPWVQSVILVSILVCVYFASHLAHNKAPAAVIRDFVGNCQFAPPTYYREGPYPPSARWCKDVSNPHATLALMNHLKVNSEGHDIVFAAEFGSLVRIAYSPKLKMYFFNPVALPAPAEVRTISCVIGAHSALYADSVEVEFLDPPQNNSARHVLTFHRRDACLIQSVMDRF